MEQEPLKKILLPKGYLSWTQISCWLSNKNRYRREYFETGHKLDTKYLQYGKSIATIIEELTYNPELKNDPEWVSKRFKLDINDERIQLFFENLVVYDSPEHEIRCEVMGVPILSYLDSYHTADNIFYEYKTGKIPWTKAKVQKHDQLTFYATGLKWKIGQMPDYCDLLWIETKDGYEEEKQSGLYNQVEKTVNITGRIISFRRVFDEREVERMENQILRCAQEISEAYRAYLAEI